jgi:hypothetical protein
LARLTKEQDEREKTFPNFRRMSALLPKAGIGWSRRDVRFVPEADSVHRTKKAKTSYRMPFKEIAPFRAQSPSPKARHKADLPIQR